MANRKTKVFISYKWEGETHDKWVEQLAGDLRIAGLEPILDKWSVRYGDSFIDYMTSMIGVADIVIFIMTAQSVQAVERSGPAGALKFEFQLAKARILAGEDVRIVPILKEETPLPMPLKHNRYADFRDDSKYRENLRDLIRDLAESSRPSDVHPVPARGPIGRRAQNLLETLFSYFGAKDFTLSLLSDKIEFTEEEIWPFDRLLHLGYIDRFLDDKTKKRRFRLSRDGIKAACSTGSYHQKP
jgi:hypothetical protein